MSDALLTGRPGGPLTGRVRAPGDKSISHRALLFGALAAGRTEISGLLEGQDVMRTGDAVRAFGAELARTGDGAWTVTGAGRFREPQDIIDCGNAGTAVRLIMGAAAGFDLAVGFTGDASLRRRPMRRVLDPLETMGVRAITRSGGRLPLMLAGGGLRGIDYLSPVASAQVKSAVLLAGLKAEGATSVIEREATRDHTERMLRAFGVPVEVAPTPHGLRARVHGGAQLQGARVLVPGDPSSAAFPLVAALLVPGSEVTVEGVLLNPMRTGLFETLRDMGADLTLENGREVAGEPTGDLTARAGGLIGVTVPRQRAPSMIDEYPILAVAAAFAEGTTVMRGIGELRVKESDRIALIAKALMQCGVEVEEEPDGLIVHGRGMRPHGGARLSTSGDHRIGMCGVVLGLGCETQVSVEEPEMIGTSFPGFTDLMRSLGADVG